jgi:hypothetical protein
LFGRGRRYLPTVPSVVSRKAKLEQNFHQPKTTASTVNPKNDRTNEVISHRPLESSIKTSLKNNEMNCAESHFSKRGTRNRLLGTDIATDQTKPFNTEVSPRKLIRSNHRRRVAPSDSSMIKPSGKIQLVSPEKPKQSTASIYISPNIEPKR